MSTLKSTVTFKTLIEDGVLAPIHRAFGEAIRRQVGEDEADVVLAAALCSEQLGRGHACLELSSVSGLAFLAGEQSFRTIQYEDWPGVSEWVDRLENSAVVTTVTSANHDSDKVSTPLVLDRERKRLYLARYWFFEQKLAASIAKRIGSTTTNESTVARLIDSLFPDRDSPGTRDQYEAVRNSIDRRFSVITGGPGTGKTTTVARLLAVRMLLHAEAGHDPSSLRILLMAPTGKAAQRLNESLARATSRLNVGPQVQSALASVTAGTIHRILGWTPLPPERGGPFRHNADLPLAADIVLVDEASMVDLALMGRLFDAIPATAQVVLIGDRDQLASVEAGSVLGDLCAERTGEPFLTEKPQKKSARPKRRKHDSRQLTLPLGDDSLDDNSESASTIDDQQQSRDGLSHCVATLKYSHRFSADSALGRLALAIREGRSDDVIEQLRNSDPAEIRWLDAAPGATAKASMGEPAGIDAVTETVELAAAAYGEFLRKLHDHAAGNQRILQAAGRVRVLCAHRGGRRGEVSVNQQIVDRLFSQRLLRGHGREAFGRLVMVSRNDYRLDLFNGDVGIVVRHEQGMSSRSSGRMILFEAPDEGSGVRRLPASLVSGVQDCFAMTIHKSQGSEFQSVFLVLPEHDSPVLTRELLYTAVTRVKEDADATSKKALPGFLCVAGSESVIRSAVLRNVHRASGIRDSIEIRLAEGFSRTDIRK